jgi:hypothetical protein
MTKPNSTLRWRLSLAQHFRHPGCAMLAEDHYGWRVRVSQRSNDG